jgi:hypothetical protein
MDERQLRRSHWRSLLQSEPKQPSRDELGAQLRLVHLRSAATYELTPALASMEYSRSYSRSSSSNRGDARAARRREDRGTPAQEDSKW